MPDDVRPGDSGKPRRAGRRTPRAAPRDGLRVARTTGVIAGEGDVVANPSAAAPQWEFVHPRCARRRQEDMEEVEAMLEAGEGEIAREELVWLLSECPDFLAAHVALGSLALEEDDFRLARGHFGRAVQVGFEALSAAGDPRPLPALLPGNRPFFEAAKGLVHTLVESGKREVAAATARRVVQLDPADPLGIGALVAGRGDAS